MEEKNRGLVKGLLIGFIGSFVIFSIVMMVVMQTFPPSSRTSGASNTEAAADKDWSSQVEEKLSEIEWYIDNHYIFDVDEEKLMDGLLAGYVTGLEDPYSVYYTPEEYASMLESANGEYYGIGVLVTQDTNGAIQIVNVFRNSPAKEAGILKGDIIAGVDDLDITGMDLNQVVGYIKGKEGTSVELQILRDGEADLLNITVERRQVSVDTVEYRMLEEGIGYIQLVQFEDVSLDQMTEAVEALKSQGMEKLILDLRDNPGGLLTSVVAIADLFLPEANIFYMEDKSGSRTDYDATADQLFEGGLVVLVNENSASASEVLAGTLKDNDRAQLVGATTFGKGIVQTFYTLSDGSGVKLTTAHYFTPNGTDIHGMGVTPHVEVEQPKDEKTGESENDTQLNKALEIIR